MLDGCTASSRISNGPKEYLKKKEREIQASGREAKRTSKRMTRIFRRDKISLRRHAATVGSPGNYAEPRTQIDILE